MKKRDDSHPKVLMQAEYIFMISVGIGFLINFFYPIWKIPVPLRIICFLLFSISSAFMVKSCWDLFDKAKTYVSPFKPAKSLVTTGPYKYSRNPQYLSRVLTQLAIRFAFGNVWIILLAIPATAIVWYGVIVPEERYLQEKFGQQYLKYKTAARCWF